MHERAQRGAQSHGGAPGAANALASLTDEQRDEINEAVGSPLCLEMSGKTKRMSRKKRAKKGGKRERYNARQSAYNLTNTTP
jgi:CelD/BcsL family acetyltransferase involved in cellulose biosynthesis